jgi:tRNA-2-methylthio-N6-dimethylallyladenosine synthase
MAEIDDVWRIRYMTSHPKDVDESLIEAHRSVSKLMPFLHLPVQSGSDKILKAMNRKHTIKEYLEKIDRFRNTRPDMVFSSDFIVGYPGETEQDFRETLALVNTVAFTQAYSFIYSPRPGTPASVYENQVPDEVKQERLQILQDCVKQHQKAFNESLQGQTLPVLIEKKGRHDGQLIGRSPYLQSVFIEAPDRLLNTLAEVKIMAGHLYSLEGKIANIESEML